MWSIRLITLTLFLLICSSLKATDPLMVWEWQFSIKNPQGQFISENISVYYYDSNSRNYIGIGGGSSLGTGKWGNGSWNAVANISGIDPDQPDATFTIPHYCPVVLSSSGCKLFKDNIL